MSSARSFGGEGLVFARKGGHDEHIDHRKHQVSRRRLPGLGLGEVYGTQPRARDIPRVGGGKSEVLAATLSGPNHGGVLSHRIARLLTASWRHNPQCNIGPYERNPQAGGVATKHLISDGMIPEIWYYISAFLRSGED